MPVIEPASTRCCVNCAAIVHSDCHIDISNIRTATSDCVVCALLLRAAEPYCSDEEQGRYITRDKSAIRMGDEGPRILRLGTTPEFSDVLKTELQVGFPRLPESGSSTQYALLRAWLRRCDESHDDCSSAIKTAMPSRLVNVGIKDTDILRLCCSNKNKKLKYIALSHCWGNLTEDEKNQFCTTDDNIKVRRNGFDLSELPKTFRDAVRVAQNIGIAYLWIDSLCIIQGNEKDWKYEAKRMEDVYAGAYCTIAATSAVDSKSGFLERIVRNEYIHIQDRLGGQFYVCTEVDDFNNDVDNALLNKRAWVLQERVLSRRTIHFSANQVYFECGAGICCESFTTLRSSFRRKYFMLDPNFPRRLLQLGDERTVDFIQFLSAEYSRRGLTNNTDRYAAITGLENRIARAKECETRFGIFLSFLHRCLLWQRPEEQDMSRIDYESQIVPSWSWMAYTGSIEFMDITLGYVEWVRSLRFNKRNKHRWLNEKKWKPALVTDVGSFQECIFEQRNIDYVVLDSGGAESGWIRYDFKTHERFDTERCVVVGRTAGGSDAEKLKYYILVVAPTNIENEYTRVGAGWILSDYVARQGVQALII